MLCIVYLLYYVNKHQEKQINTTKKRKEKKIKLDLPNWQM